MKERHQVSMGNAEVGPRRATGVVPNAATTSLRVIASRGITVTAVATFAASAIQLGQLALLGRLLSAEDFGLWAMLTSVIGLAQGVSDIGLSSVVVQRKHVTSKELSTIYWASLGAGLLFFGLGLASTPVLVAMFKEERLRQLVPWYCTLFLVAPVGQQFSSLLRRNLDFRDLAWVNVAAPAIGAVVAVVAAWQGAGVFALLGGQLASAVTRALILMIFGWRLWRPQLHFNWQEFTEYVGFGLYRTGTQLIDYFGARLDQLLTGALLGAGELGYYAFAVNLVSMPVSRINPVVTQVALPLFAQVQDDNTRLRRGYLLGVRMLSAVNGPLLLGLAALAPDTIPAVFGKQWTSSVRVIQLLAVVYFLRSVMNPVGALLLAKGLPGKELAWNIGTVIAQTLTVYFAASRYGVIGVALGLAIFQATWLALGYILLLRPVVGPCSRDYIRSFGPSLLTSVIAASAAVVVRSVTTFANPWVNISLEVISVGLVYIALTWTLARKQGGVRRFYIQA